MGGGPCRRNLRAIAGDDGVIEFVDLCIDMQKRVIDAHEQSMKAMQANLKGNDAGVAMHKAMTDAGNANVAAWERWIALWTGRK